MSSKGASAMGEESSEKSTLVPRLRFPEFREAEGWAAKSLKNTCTVNPSNSELPEKFAYIDLESVEAGELKARKIINRDEAPSRAQRLLRHGDVIFQIVRPYQRNNLHFKIAEKIPYVASTGYAQLRAKESEDFLFQAVHTDDFVERVIAKCTGSNYPAINSSDLADISLAIPNKAEQEKIADCLSSLDELIAAETQKLDAFKTHKKGLMQQLFPREGETVPRLRFPEYREAGVWEETRLGDIGSVRMCKRILKEQTSPRGDIPFYKIGTFGGVPDAYISREIFENFRSSYPFPKNGAVLISAAGTIGRTVRYNGELAYFQDSNIVWLDNSEKLIADNFLFYLYQLIDWSPSVGAIQRLYNENILGAKVKFPSIPEQQEIADCLSSLDDLITAQSQKIDALKTHKKGLMQQLFPVLDEVPT